MSSQQTLPTPGFAARPPASRRLTPGPALTVLGVGAAATALFGLPLGSETGFDLTTYELLHSLTDQSSNADRFLGSYTFWWSWGQLTFGLVVLALAALLLLGMAQRILGFVVAAAGLVFGVLELLALADAPTYRSIQQFRPNGEHILSNASAGVWFGIAGVVLLVLGAALTALQARPHASTVAYPPAPPASYPPATEQPAKQL